jgi:phosphoribosyl-ATP pyrophosphohydrolase
MTNSPPVLYDLMCVIEERRANPSSRSYTSRLLADGPQAIGAKILEEAEEVVQAGQEISRPADRQHLVHEAADLMYHLLVLLGYHHLHLTDVEQELGKRFGVSGLDEKAARQPPQPPQPADRDHE